MRELPEYEGKDLLRKVGIRVPAGRVISTADEPVGGAPAVIKAQIPVSSRGKKGGIRFADTEAEIKTTVSDLLGSSIDGHEVERVLVEECVDVERELYVGFSADGSEDLPSLLLSLEGGAEIETVPKDRIAAVPVNPLVGMQPFHLQNGIAKLAKSQPKAAGTIPADALEEVLLAAWNVFDDGDLRVLEVNPLGIDGDDLVAMDAKVIPDDAASYRQEYADTATGQAPLETEAAAEGIELRVSDGSVGIISNGAGMGLSTLDLVEQHPGHGFAGFIDTHGAQFDWDEIHDFLSYLERAGSQVVLVNIIGPFLDCSSIATELVAAVESGYDVPIIARFKGLEHEAALQICVDAGIPAEREVKAAVEHVVTLLDGRAA